VDLWFSTPLYLLAFFLVCHLVDRLAQRTLGGDEKN